jgi:hypothetical protein
VKSMSNANGLNGTPSRTQLREAYESKTWQVLGDCRFAFVTVNLPPSSVHRIMSKHQANANPYKLGHEYSNAIRSGVPVLDAAKTLWGKFFLRLNTRLLKSESTNQGRRLRYVRVYENDGKSYSARAVSHVHMLIERPRLCTFDHFSSQFRWLFSEVVYPASLESNVLNFKDGRDDHPWYVLKQHITPEIASDRFEFHVPHIDGRRQ